MKKDNLISETGESLRVLWNQRAQYGQIIVCSKHHFRRITYSKRPNDIYFKQKN